MFNQIAPPNCQDILEDKFGEPIDCELGEWRHGPLRIEVYYRAEDDTYWRARYRVSTDGETNELREGLASIVRVWPSRVTAIEYTTSEPTS